MGEIIWYMRQSVCPEEESTSLGGLPEIIMLRLTGYDPENVMHIFRFFIFLSLLSLYIVSEELNCCFLFSLGVTIIWKCQKILVSDNSFLTSLFSSYDLCWEIFTAKILTVGYLIYPCLRAFTHKGCETVLLRAIIHAHGRANFVFFATPCVTYLCNLLKIAFLKKPLGSVKSYKCLYSVMC